jgi:hypothetical protein
MKKGSEKSGCGLGLVGSRRDDIFHPHSRRRPTKRQPAGVRIEESRSLLTASGAWGQGAKEYADNSDATLLFARSGGNCRTLSAQPLKSTHPGSRWKKKDRSLAACCWFCRPVPSPQSPSGEPGPRLPTGFNGATGPENSSQLGFEEFVNDPMLTRLIDQALVVNRELKILAQSLCEKAADFRLRLQFRGL